MRQEEEQSDLDFSRPRGTLCSEVPMPTLSPPTLTEKKAVLGDIRHSCRAISSGPGCRPGRVPERPESTRRMSSNLPPGLQFRLLRPEDSLTELTSLLHRAYSGLAEMGFREEAEGHNAIAGGFQGQRQWTDHLPNGDFLEAILCTSFDWNGIRQPFQVATENDALNGASILTENPGYGAAWLRPYEIMGGRLFKFSGQIDF